MPHVIQLPSKKIVEPQLNKLRAFLSINLAGDGRSEPQFFQNILDTLRDQPAQLVVQQLHEHYLPAADEQRNPQARYEFLELALPEIKRCVPVLEKMISEANLPLREENSAIALVADNFLKNLAAAYCGIAKSISGRHLDLFRKSTRRAMQALLHRQMIAYRASATPSSSSWQGMHDLFSNARSHGIAALGEDHSIQHIYLCALLMAYAKPKKIPRQNLEALYQTVKSLTHFAGILDGTEIDQFKASPSARFLVNIGQGNPGQSLASAGTDNAVASNLIIECRGIVSALDRKLAALDPQQNAQDNVLMILRIALCGQMTRRYSQTSRE